MKLSNKGLAIILVQVLVLIWLNLVILRHLYQSKQVKDIKKSSHPNISAIITCMSGFRNCTSLPELLQGITPFVMEVTESDQNYEIHMTNSQSRFQNNTGITRQSFWLSDAISAPKIKQFRHFMSVMGMTLQSTMTCTHSSSVVIFLDDDVIPCPDHWTWLPIIMAWLQDFSHVISAIRVGPGTSGVITTCATLSAMHAFLNKRSDLEITAIDDMMDRFLESHGHYLTFHHTLFTHIDDHVSLVQPRTSWSTSRLLHFCQAPVMWRADGGCESRIFRPCEHLHGLPEIPDMDMHSSPKSPCAGFELVKRNWRFLLGRQGESCKQVCEKHFTFTCDVQGLDVLNTIPNLKQLYECPHPLEDSHKVTAPHVESTYCFSRATRCLFGSTDGFCDEQDPSTSRFCPCSTTQTELTLG